jgi:phosphatidate phosphatase APP1
VTWLLIGDDGQHDEEIYGNFVTSHADRVIAVCIRQLSPGQAVLAGSAGKTHAAPINSTVPWLYGADGSIFVEKLKELGLLVDDEKQPTVE